MAKVRIGDPTYGQTHTLNLWFQVFCTIAISISNRLCYSY